MKKKLLKTATISALTLLVTGGTSPVFASTWVANTPESIQIKEGQTSYTMVLGDTLWAISQRTNLTVQTLADINEINLTLGEQFLLPIGRTIYFDGNTVTVKTSNGEIVSETVVTDEQKVNPNQNVGESVDSTVTAPTPANPVVPTEPTTPVNPTEPVEPTEPTNPTEPTDPVDPTKPVDPVDPEEPTDPTEPEKPVGPFAGDIIPGVENGIVGTWTDQDALMDAMDDYKLANNLHGSEWDYLILNNGYGFYAVWVNQ